MHQKVSDLYRGKPFRGVRQGHPSGVGLSLRIVLLRTKSHGAGRQDEHGASLVVALVAAFVLLLGVASLAARTNFGFIGQAFQVQNRQARDVAENAITEFADTMNQEPYRHLLIAGTTENWTSSKIASDFTNICTAFDKTTDALNADGSGNAITVAPETSVYEAFKEGAGFQDRGNGRSFRVENIEFLTENREPYVDGSGDFLEDDSDTSYGVIYRSGRDRSLIRITVIGRVNQNGRVSEARVAREFEVVPKCCNRSFGANIFGGENWGRDGRACLSPGGPGEPGLIAGLGGGQASGSGNSKPILKEDGTPVTEAACWNGNQDGQPSVLNGTPNANCTNGTSAIGNISFSPAKISFDPPTYGTPPPKTDGTSVTVTPAAVPTNRDGVIYFATPVSNPNNFVNSGLVLRRSDGSITRINGTSLTSNTPDPCYVKQSLDVVNGRPYPTIHCSITSISTSGSRKVYIDTSAAKINLFFSGNSSYGLGSGNNGVFRLHTYRSDLAAAPSNSCSLNTSPTASCFIRWPSVTEGSPITSANRLGTFLELCGDRSYDCDGDKSEEFAVRNLLNFYAAGSGTFVIGGASSGLGFNIYAQNATVRLNGGGQNDNFMGQIWTNNLIINGNISIRTFSGSGGTSPPGTLAGAPLIDFIARSFTQSSGF